MSSETWQPRSRTGIGILDDAVHSGLAVVYGSSASTRMLTGSQFRSHTGEASSVHFLCRNRHHQGIALDISMKNPLRRGGGIT